MRYSHRLRPPVGSSRRAMLPTALDLADRGYVLQTGRVVLEGRSEESRGSELVM